MFRLPSVFKPQLLEHGRAATITRSLEALHTRAQDTAPGDRNFVGSKLIYEAESFIGPRASWWHKGKLIIYSIIMATMLQDRAGTSQPLPAFLHSRKRDGGRIPVIELGPWQSAHK
ncbi:hypothetical protein BV22DRAFT_831976 [Leucogyrophana mollusca]|uniref:Uncharacterized protein n=1 Tax=Leucogyrophana mollusca TaxID=85980 RepID=A0ACB8B2T9_9AGAM|nr:hypothetical protein BV22DRAFT_831976 [Leucogyrophana mollusca]